MHFLNLSLDLLLSLLHIACLVSRLGESLRDFPVEILYVPQNFLGDQQIELSEVFRHHIVTGV